MSWKSVLPSQATCFLLHFLVNMINQIFSTMLFHLCIGAILIWSITMSWTKLSPCKWWMWSTLPTVMKKVTKKVAFCIDDCVRDPSELIMIQNDRGWALNLTDFQQCGKNTHLRKDKVQEIFNCHTRNYESSWTKHREKIEGKCFSFGMNKNFLWSPKYSNNMQLEYFKSKMLLYSKGNNQQSKEIS